MRESQEKKLIKIKENAAGFPEYKRANISVVHGDTAESMMGRRNFLAGLSSLLTAAALGEVALVARKKSELQGTRAPQPQGSANLDSEAIDELISADSNNTSMLSSEVGKGSIESFSESQHFNREVEIYARQYAKDKQEVLEYASKATKGDGQGRSRLQYVSEELHIEGIPQTVAAELQTYIVGLCDVESSFNAAKISPRGASGLMQFMPATFKEHAPDGANILSLIDQVNAAKEKFAQIYDYLEGTCTSMLDAVRTEFFSGNDESFEKEFLTPLIINGYNAGEGTMADMVKWFVTAYKSPEETVGVFQQGEAASGYDVFLTLALKGFENKVNPHYGSDACAYVTKIYGATRSLRQEDLI